MVRLFLLLSLCTLGVGTANSENIKTRPVIKSVVIEENAAWTTHISSDEPPEACADFILTKADVRQLFKVAREATEREYEHDLDMSRCYASGRAVLQDGREAHWKIDRMRRGAQWFSDGTILYFYCGKCRSKKFYEDCDIDCINQ